MPILAATALAMRASGDNGPFLYRAPRVGEGMRRIEILKIRTMVPGAAGHALTVAGDGRVTRVGRVLRRYRIDELPQLINVLRGEMSLVGPRPEDPRFVDPRDPLHRRVFSARPGITGLAQLTFHDEAARLTDGDVEEHYRTAIQPEKLRLDADYLDRQSVRLDLEIILQTVRTVIR
jgi:lipopolysaccharide/colanic/teichoic acid biosynthesis glycosyltransferase